MSGKWDQYFTTPMAQPSPGDSPARTDNRPRNVPYREVGVEGILAIRFSLISRQRTRWSYPYSYLGLIEAPSSEEMILHCNCGLVKVIQIKGRGLEPILHLLGLQRLIELWEGDHPIFDTSETVVSKISIDFVKEESSG